MKYATTLDEQVEKLKNRGLVINDEEKAKEVLLDIGYYRFGAYLFPFEKKYPMDRYAPAWKTVELMTIGNIQALYNNLKKPDVQADIALHYGVAKIGIFQSYFETIRKARNMCAHGNVLFDTKLPQRLPHGPAGNLAQPNNSNIIGIIAVIQYFIKQISIHRHQEMCDELEDLLKKVNNEKVREILEKVSGFETF